MLGINWHNPKKIPYFIAYSLASILELFAKIRKSQDPPLITRYAVAAMGKNLTYNIDKAKIELNYKPKVDLDTGLFELKEWVRDIGGIDYLSKLYKPN